MCFKFIIFQILEGNAIHVPYIMYYSYWGMGQQPLIKHQKICLVKFIHNKWDLKKETLTHSLQIKIRLQMSLDHVMFVIN